MEKCANCERAIGNLETPMIWRGAVVCAGCHTKLSGATWLMTPAFAPAWSWAMSRSKQNISDSRMIFAGPVMSITARGAAWRNHG